MTIDEMERALSDDTELNALYMNALGLDDDGELPQSEDELALEDPALDAAYNKLLGIDDGGLDAAYHRALGIGPEMDAEPVAATETEPVTEHVAKLSPEPEPELIIEPNVAATESPVEEPAEPTVTKPDESVGVAIDEQVAEKILAGEPVAPEETPIPQLEPGVIPLPDKNKPKPEPIMDEQTVAEWQEYEKKVNKMLAEERAALEREQKAAKSAQQKIEFEQKWAGRTPQTEGEKIEKGMDLVLGVQDVSAFGVNEQTFRAAMAAVPKIKTQVNVPEAVSIQDADSYPMDQMRMLLENSVSKEDYQQNAEGLKWYNNYYARVSQAKNDKEYEEFSRITKDEAPIAERIAWRLQDTDLLARLWAQGHVGFSALGRHGGVVGKWLERQWIRMFGQTPAGKVGEALGQSIRRAIEGQGYKGTMASAVQLAQESGYLKGTGSVVLDAALFDLPGFLTGGDLLLMEALGPVGGFVAMTAAGQALNNATRAQRGEPTHWDMAEVGRSAILGLLLKHLPVPQKLIPVGGAVQRISKSVAMAAYKTVELTLAEALMGKKPDVDGMLRLFIIIGGSGARNTIRQYGAGCIETQLRADGMSAEKAQYFANEYMKVESEQARRDLRREMRKHIVNEKAADNLLDAVDYMIKEVRNHYTEYLRLKKQGKDIPRENEAANNIVQEMKLRRREEKIKDLTARAKEGDTAAMRDLERLTGTRTPEQSAAEKAAEKAAETETEAQEQQRLERPAIDVEAEVVREVPEEVLTAEGRLEKAGPEIKMLPGPEPEAKTETTPEAQVQPSAEVEGKIVVPEPAVKPEVEARIDETQAQVESAAEGKDVVTSTDESAAEGKDVVASTEPSAEGERVTWRPIPLRPESTEPIQPMPEPTEGVKRFVVSAPLTPHKKAEGYYAWVDMASPEMAERLDPRRAFKVGVQERIREGYGYDESRRQRLNAFDATWMTDSMTSDRGGPMADKNGLIVAGYGRIGTIKDVYDLPVSDPRRQQLIEEQNKHAISVGLSRAPEGMRAPFVMRVIDKYSGTTDMKDFARESNKSVAEQMRQAEIALSDARLIDNLNLLKWINVPESGNIMHRDNKQFWGSFFNALPDKSTLLNRDGHIRIDMLQKRLETALLFNILQGNPEVFDTASTIIENAGYLGLKNMVNGLTQSAADLTWMRKNRPDFDLTNVLARIFPELLVVKQAVLEGTAKSLEEAMAQGSFFADPLTRTEREVIKTLVYSKSGAQLRRIFKRYREVASDCDPTQLDLFERDAEGGFAVREANAVQKFIECRNQEWTESQLAERLKQGKKWGEGDSILDLMAIAAKKNMVEPGQEDVVGDDADGIQHRELANLAGGGSSEVTEGLFDGTQKELQNRAKSLQNAVQDGRVPVDDAIDRLEREADSQKSRRTADNIKKRDAAPKFGQIASKSNPVGRVKYETRSGSDKAQAERFQQQALEALSQAKAGAEHGASEQFVVVAGGYAEELLNKGFADFRGQKLRDEHDAFELMQGARNPAIEVFRFLVVDQNGNVLLDVPYSSRMPDATYTPGVASQEVIALCEMARENGLKVYHAHNHPSGNVTVSDADRRVDAEMTKRWGDVYGGHYIIDHGRMGILRHGESYLYEEKVGAVDPLKAEPEVRHRLLDLKWDRENWRKSAGKNMKLLKEREKERGENTALVVLCGLDDMTWTTRGMAEVDVHWFMDGDGWSVTREFARRSNGIAPILFLSEKQSKNPEVVRQAKDMIQNGRLMDVVAEINGKIVSLKTGMENVKEFAWFEGEESKWTLMMPVREQRGKWEGAPNEAPEDKAIVDAARVLASHNVRTVEDAKRILAAYSDMFRDDWGRIAELSRRMIERGEVESWVAQQAYAQGAVVSGADLTDRMGDREKEVDIPISDDPNYSIMRVPPPEIWFLFNELSNGKYPQLRRGMVNALGRYRLGQKDIHLLQEMFHLVPPTKMHKIIKQAWFEASGIEDLPDGAIQSEAGVISFEPSPRDFPQAVIDKYKQIRHRLYDEQLEEIVKDNPAWAAKVFAHELFHHIDYLPEAVIRKGNIFAHLATLDKYVLKTLPITPEQDDLRLPQSVIKSVRAEARRRAGKQPKPGDKAAREIWNRAASDNYRVLIEQAKRDFGLVSLESVESELVELIKWWLGQDELTDYQMKPNELYAEAGSVLINNPEALHKRAPLFAKLFFEYLDKKPEVKQAYNELQERLKAGDPDDTLTQRITESMRETDQLGAIQRSQKKTWQEKRAELATNYLRAFWPWQVRLRKAPGGAEAIEAIGDHLYRKTFCEAYLNDMRHDVYNKLQDIGISWEDFGIYMYYRRVGYENLGEFKGRMTLANPWFVTPEIAREKLKTLSEKYGAQLWEMVVRLKSVERDLWNKHIVDREREFNVFGSEMEDIMRSNREYCTFAPVFGDWAELDGKLEGIFEQKWGNGIGGKIWRQHGYLGPIMNPASATVMKGTQLISFMYKERAKWEAVQSLQQSEHSSLLQEAERKWDGKKWQIKEMETDRVGTLYILHGGKLHAYYAPRFLVDQWSKSSHIELQTIMRALPFVSKLAKDALTNKNLIFATTRNLPRDIRDFNLKMPGVSRRWRTYVPGTLGPAGEFIVEAFKAQWKAYRGEKSELADKVVERGMVIAMAEGFWGENPGIDPFMRELHRRGIDPMDGSDETAMKILRTIWGKVNYTLDFGQVLERTMKTVGMMYVDKYFPDAPESWKRHIVRNFSGSPDFPQRPLRNLDLSGGPLYWNADKEGKISTFMWFKERPFEAAWMTARRVFMPLLLNYLLFGGLRALFSGRKKDDYELMWQAIPRHDKITYRCVPIMWADKQQRKVLYWIRPLSDAERSFHAIATIALETWLNKESGTKDKIWEGIASSWGYMADDAPGLNPLTQLALDALVISTGGNPARRGHFMLSQDEMDGPATRKYLKILTEEYNQTLGSLMYRFDTRQDAPTSKIEKVVRNPVGSLTIGKFLRVSNRGWAEHEKIVTEFARYNEIMLRQKSTDIIRGFIRDGNLKMSSDDVTMLYFGEQVAKQQRRKQSKKEFLSDTERKAAYFYIHFMTKLEQAVLERYAPREYVGITRAGSAWQKQKLIENLLKQFGVSGELVQSLQNSKSDKFIQNKLAIEALKGVEGMQGIQNMLAGYDPDEDSKLLETK